MNERIIVLLGFGSVDDGLGVIEGEAAGESEATPKPDIEESLRRSKHAQDTDEEHAGTGHTKSTTPVEELLAGSHIGDSTKSCH